MVDLSMSPGLGACRGHALTTCVTSFSLWWPYFVLERFTMAAQHMEMRMSILWLIHGLEIWKWTRIVVVT